MADKTQACPESATANDARKIKSVKTISPPYNSLVHIAIVLLTRYPTAKAYGVTTLYTAEALKDLGHRVEIYSPNNLSFISSSSWTSKFLKAAVSTLYPLSTRRRYFSKLLFILSSVIWLRLMSRYMKNHHFDLIWSRDLLVPRLIGGISKHFCELHTIPNSLLLKLNIVKRRHGVVLGPISPFIFRYLQERFQSLKQIAYAPMGVPEFFFKEVPVSVDLSSINLGYVGRFKSVGHEQGVDLLVKSFLDMKENSPFDLKLTLVGISNSELHTLASLCNESFESLARKGVRNFEYVNHEKIPEIVSDFDIAVIPYIENTQFLGRFPIKAMEYAALGKPVICSDANFLNDIFITTQVWFYNPKSRSQLAETVNKMRSMPHEVVRRAVENQNYARDFTYQKRVANIISKLSNDISA